MKKNQTNPAPAVELDMFTAAYIATALQLCDEELGPEASIDQLAPETCPKSLPNATLSNLAPKQCTRMPTRKKEAKWAPIFG